MAKHKRSGGKIGGKHTSFIPLADEIVSRVLVHPNVTKVIPGFITAGLPTLRGQRRVKLSMHGTALKLSVRDNISHQEVFVHAGSEEDIKKPVHTRGFQGVHYGNKQTRTAQQHFRNDTGNEKSG